VTPSAAVSRARDFRKAVNPVLAVLETMRFAIGCRTATDVMATTRPHDRSRIPGTTRQHISMGASRVPSTPRA
jgi:hypothetical protein